MKLKLIPILLLLLFPVFAKPTSAAPFTCEIADFNFETRNLTTCIHGFDTIDEINGTVADFYCLNNSNAEYYNIQGPCDAQGGVRNMTGYTNCIGNADCPVAVDGNGKYYTCLIGQAMSRGVGRLMVRFSKGGALCNTAPMRTIPPDWNPDTEGGVTQTAGRFGSAILECNDGKGINTALGCIPTDFTGGGFVTALLRLAVGIGSGIALLLILYGIFVVTTSAGIPDKLNAGRDTITSAIAGLLFIILSIFLLNLVGVKILAIPGL